MERPDTVVAYDEAGFSSVLGDVQLISMMGSKTSMPKQSVNCQTAIATHLWTMNVKFGMDDTTNSLLVGLLGITFCFYTVNRKNTKMFLFLSSIKPS